MAAKYNIDPNNPFADIDESDFENELARPAKQTKSAHLEDIGNIEIPGFVEDCPKCRGTGSWSMTHGHGRTGMYNDGRCSKCNGKGKLTFKTAPEARARARASAAERKVRKAEEVKLAFWSACHNDVADWLKNNRESNQFAMDLCNQGEKWGQLSEKQIAAIRKNIAREDDAKVMVEKFAKEEPAVYAWLISETENGNEFAGSLLQGLRRYGHLTGGQMSAVKRNLHKVSNVKESAMDISSLKGYYAVPNGDTRLKICVRKPGKNSNWYGWTFVDDGAAYGRRRTYGKQAPDGMYQGSIQEELQAILDNPFEAQVAYGHLTGTCGMCGRQLEDEQSIEAGIGPICASKYS
jgi:hypothetical protein